MTLGALSREEPGAGCFGRAEKPKQRRAARLNSLCPFKSGAMFADPIGPSEQQGRDHKHHMNSDKPGKLFGIHVHIKIHKGLEHLDCRNGDN